MNLIKRLQGFKTSGIGVVFVAVVVIYISTSGEPPAVAAQEPSRATASPTPGPVRLKAEPFYGSKPFESASKPLEAEPPVWHINETKKSACIEADERPLHLCFRELSSDIALTTFDVPARDAKGSSVMEVKFLYRHSGKLITKKYPIKVAVDNGKAVGIVDQMETMDFADRVNKSERLTARVTLANGRVNTVHFVVPRSEDMVFSQ